MYEQCVLKFRWKSGFKIDEWNGKGVKRHNRRRERIIRSRTEETWEAARGKPAVIRIQIRRVRRRIAKVLYKKRRGTRPNFRSRFIDLTWYKTLTKMIDPVVRQMWTNRCKLLLGVILSIKSLVDTFDTWCDMFDRFSSEFLILRNNNNNNKLVDRKTERCTCKKDSMAKRSIRFQKQIANRVACMYDVSIDLYCTHAGVTWQNSYVNIGNNTMDNTRIYAHTHKYTAAGSYRSIFKFSIPTGGTRYKVILTRTSQKSHRYDSAFFN